MGANPLPPTCTKKILCVELKTNSLKIRGFHPPPLQNSRGVATHNSV